MHHWRSIVRIDTGNFSLVALQAATKSRSDKFDSTKVILVSFPFSDYFLHHMWKTRGCLLNFMTVRNIQFIISHHPLCSVPVDV